jgi:hypothetical protein
MLIAVSVTVHVARLKFRQPVGQQSACNSAQ